MSPNRMNGNGSPSESFELPPELESLESKLRQMTPREVDWPARDEPSAAVRIPPTCRVGPFVAGMLTGAVAVLLVGVVMPEPPPAHHRVVVVPVPPSHSTPPTDDHSRRPRDHHRVDEPSAEGALPSDDQPPRHLAWWTDLVLGFVGGLNTPVECAADRSDEFLGCTALPRLEFREWPLRQRHVHHPDFDADVPTYRGASSPAEDISSRYHDLLDEYLDVASGAL